MNLIFFSQNLKDDIYVCIKTINGCVWSLDYSHYDITILIIFYFNKARLKIWICSS